MAPDDPNDTNRPPAPYGHRFDAEGSREGEPCPECGSDATTTWRYAEGFEELDCDRCGYASDAEELDALQRYRGDLLERRRGDGPPPPVPRKGLKA